MNSNDFDHPDLTAHVLGELDAEHAEAMATWLESHPEAKSEASQIHNLAQLLAESAPVSFHTLLPEQRTTVLSGPQRVRQMVAAVQQPKKREVRGNGYPYAWSALRFAAAAAFATIGYVAGVHFATRQNVLSPSLVAQPSVETEGPKAKPQTTPFRAKELAVPVMAEAPVPTAPLPVAAPKSEAVPAKTAEEPKVAAVVAEAPKLTELPTSASSDSLAVSRAANNVVRAQGFVSTSKNTVAQVGVRPATRSASSTSKTSTGLVLGSPMSANVLTKKDVSPARGSRGSELLIHSWKADVISCPWDESRRLVRLVIQMPADQPTTAASFPLQMNFSPATVRSFRQLGERSVPAKDADSPALHIVWFEAIPNGPLAEGGTRVLGDFTLANAHFTTQGMSAFDSSRMKVLDRGTAWQNAHQDFLFESAVIGFGLLMGGDKDSGALNHSQVLDLALRSKQDEKNSEVTKFVKVVRDAGRFAGLK